MINSWYFFFHLKTNDVHYVDFDQQIFPTVDQLKDELQNWNWIFGRTPKFKLTNHETINDEQFRCELDIVKGLIDNVTIFKQNNQLPDNDLIKSIKGKKLILDHCESALNDWLSSKTDFQSIYLNNLVLNTIKSIG